MKIFSNSSGNDGRHAAAAHPANTRAHNQARPEPPQRGQAPLPASSSRGKKAPEPENTNQGKKGRGKGCLITFLVILIILASVFIYWKITTRPPDVTPPTPDVVNTANPEETPIITDTENREIGRYYTVLVVGEDQLKANTDTMMLARYDAVEHKVNVVSIPRDTLVNTPGANKKINTVYYRRDNGGIEGMMDVVEGITGFRPDNYVIVQTDVFEKVVDALGGVTFDVPRKMDYDDYTPLPNGEQYVFQIHLEAGEQWLSGADALKVFRFRQNNNGTGYAGGDVERLDTQHDLLMAIAGQALKLNNLPKLINVAKILIDNSKTDLKIGELQWYAEQFLQMSMEDVSIVTMPGDYYCNIRNVSYVSINVDEWMNMVNTSLNPMKKPIEAANCNILYQVAYDGGIYNLDPNNYKTTNGSEIAGGLNSFYSN